MLLIRQFSEWYNKMNHHFACTTRCLWRFWSDILFIVLLRTATPNQIQINSYYTHTSHARTMHNSAWSFFSYWKIYSMTKCRFTFIEPRISQWTIAKGLDELCFWTAQCSFASIITYCALCCDQKLSTVSSIAQPAFAHSLVKKQFNKLHPKFELRNLMLTYNI